MNRAGRPFASAVAAMWVFCAFGAGARGQAVSAVTQIDEVRAAHAYDAAVREGPPAMRMFLADFPKGADLHVHLSGAVYAETFIREAGEDGLCVRYRSAELRQAALYR